MSKLETNQVDPSTGTTLTLGTSGDTIAIPSGVTIANSGTATGFGGDNTPYFYGKLASAQSVSRATMTKVTGMTSGEIDSDSAFDGTTFTVPSGEAGKYYIEGAVTGDYSSVGQDGEETVSAIRKNGSEVKLATIRQSSSSGQNMRVVTTVASAILDLSVGDYIELYAHIQDASGSDASVAAGLTSLLGYKLIT
jgi:hypothetical protein